METISNQEPTSQEFNREDFMSSLEEEKVLQNEQGSFESEEVIENEGQYEIDDKFKDLPENEAILRTYQSRYDKLYKKHEEVLKEAETKSKLVDFVTDLEEDDAILEAYLRERKPELVSKRDISTIVKEKLNEEFPEFVENKPTPQDGYDDPGGRAWLYFKRLDELYGDLKGSSSKSQTIKEIREERNKQKAEKDAELKLQLEDVQKRMKWDESKLQNFVNWANKTNVYELAKIYNLGMNTMKISSVSNLPGDSRKGKTARQSFLEGL